MEVFFCVDAQKVLKKQPDKALSRIKRSEDTKKEADRNDLWTLSSGF